MTDIMIGEERRRMVRLVSAVSLLGLVLSGCSGYAHARAAGETWADVIETIKRDPATTEFIRDVLADGEVTVAEAREAVEQFGACMADNGLGYWVEEDPSGWPLTGEQTVLWSPAPHQPDQWDDASFGCQEAWLGITWPLNELGREMQMNPFNEDPDDLTARCLVRNGLAPEGFDGGDLREFQRPFHFWTGDARGEREAAERQATAVLPGGATWLSAEVGECRLDHRFDLTEARG